jgi:hypothetical protein
LRLILSCGKCVTTGQVGGAFVYAEYRDDNLYQIVCPAGHKTTAILQQQRFELLFEMGAYAILDGYYREAVSSFVASLERFYEFGTRILLLESSGSDDLFQKSWKNVASQSERQLGAFAFVWATRFKEPPPLLSNKLTTFRNDVTHKGRIPSRGEAIDFGNSVLTTLAKMIAVIEGALPEHIVRITKIHLRTISPKNLGRPVATASTDTIISLSRKNAAEPIQSLDAQLSRLEAKRRTLDQFIQFVKRQP